MAVHLVVVLIIAGPALANAVLLPVAIVLSTFIISVVIAAGDLLPVHPEPRRAVAHVGVLDHRVQQLRARLLGLASPGIGLAVARRRRRVARAGVEPVQLVEVGARLCVRRPLLAALLGLAEVLVDVLPLLLAALGAAAVARRRHARAHLLPQRALEPGLLEPPFQPRPHPDQRLHLVLGPPRRAEVQRPAGAAPIVRRRVPAVVRHQLLAVAGRRRVLARVVAGRRGGRWERDGLARDLFQVGDDGGLPRRGASAVLRARAGLAGELVGLLPPPGLVPRSALPLAPLHGLQELPVEALLVLHQTLHEPLEEGRRRAQLLLLLLPPTLPLAPRRVRRRLELRLRLHHRGRLLPGRRLRRVELRARGRGRHVREVRHGRLEDGIVVSGEAGAGARLGDARAAAPRLVDGLQLAEQLVVAAARGRSGCGSSGIIVAFLEVIGGGNRRGGLRRGHLLLPRPLAAARAV